MIQAPYAPSPNYKPQPEVIPAGIMAELDGTLNQEIPRESRVVEGIKGAAVAGAGTGGTIIVLKAFRDAMVNGANKTRAFEIYKEHIKDIDLKAIKKDSPDLANALGDVKKLFEGKGNFFSKLNVAGLGRGKPQDVLVGLENLQHSVLDGLKELVDRGVSDVLDAESLKTSADSLGDAMKDITAGKYNTTTIGDQLSAVQDVLIELGSKMDSRDKGVDLSKGMDGNLGDKLNEAIKAVHLRIKDNPLSGKQKALITGAAALAVISGAAYGIHKANQRNKNGEKVMATAVALQEDSLKQAADSLMLKEQLVIDNDVIMAQQAALAQPTNVIVEAQQPQPMLGGVMQLSNGQQGIVSPAGFAPDPGTEVNRAANFADRAQTLDPTLSMSDRVRLQQAREQQVDAGSMQV